MSRTAQLVILVVNFSDEWHEDCLRYPISQIHGPLHQVVIRNIIPKGKDEKEYKQRVKI